MNNSSIQELEIEDILHMYAGYHATKIIAIGVALEIFEEISKQEYGIDIASLSKNLNLKSEPLEYFCNSACAHGILKYKDELFTIPEKTAQAIQEIGGHSNYCIATAQDVEEYIGYIKNGNCLDVSERSDLYTSAVSLALRRSYRVLANTLLPQVPALQETLNKGGSVLEIGCGEGYGLIYLARLFPQIILQGVDIDPSTLSALDRKLKEEGLEKRISCSNILQGEEKFDFIYLTSALHEIKDPALLLRKYKNRLTKNGVLLVADFLKPKPPTEPLSSIDRVIHGLYFDEAMQGTPYLEDSHIYDILMDSGYSNLKKLDTSQNPYTSAYYCYGGEKDE